MPPSQVHDTIIIIMINSWRLRPFQANSHRMSDYALTCFTFITVPLSNCTFYSSGWDYLQCYYVPLLHVC